MVNIAGEVAQVNGIEDVQTARKSGESGIYWNSGSD